MDILPGLFQLPAMQRQWVMISYHSTSDASSAKKMLTLFRSSRYLLMIAYASHVIRCYRKNQKTPGLFIRQPLCNCYFFGFRVSHNSLTSW